MMVTSIRSIGSQKDSFKMTEKIANSASYIQQKYPSRIKEK